MDEDPNWYIKTLIAKPLSFKNRFVISQKWNRIDFMDEYLSLLQQALIDITSPIPQLRIILLLDYFVVSLNLTFRYSRSAADRDSINNTLMTLKNSIAIPALINQLQAKEIPQRVNAARALSLFKTEIARSPLESSLNDSAHEVRLAATYALRLISNPQSVSALLGAINDQNHRVRAEVTYTLGCISAPETMVNLGNLLTDPSAQVRRNAVLALGQIDHPFAIESIRCALDDPSDFVKATAIDTLYELKDTSALEQILHLCNHSSSTLRQKSIEYLQNCPQERAIQRLSKALDDQDEDVAITAIVSSGKLPKPDSIPILIDILSVDELNEWAIDLLGRFPLRQVLMELLQKLTHEGDANWYLTEAIVVRLQTLLLEEPLFQCEELVKYLLPMLDAPLEEVAPQVLEYFSRLTEKTAVIQLVHALGHENVHISKNAGTLLIQIGKPAFLPLYEAQGYPLPTIREKAKLLLGAFHF